MKGEEKKREEPCLIKKQRLHANCTLLLGRKRLISSSIHQVLCIGPTFSWYPVQLTRRSSRLPAEITRRSSRTLVGDSLSRPRSGSLEVACGTPRRLAEAMCGVSGHPTEVARWSSPRCKHMHVTTSCLYHTCLRPQRAPRAIQIAGSVHPSELAYGIHVS